MTLTWCRHGLLKVDCRQCTPRLGDVELPPAPTKVVPNWPAKCAKCGAPAVVLFRTIECSLGCR